MGTKISLGVIIGICLIVYWYMKDHPQPENVTRQSFEYHYLIDG